MIVAVGFGCFIGCERRNAPGLRIDQIELEIFGAQIRENVNGPLYYVGK